MTKSFGCWAYLFITFFLFNHTAMVGNAMADSGRTNGGFGELKSLDFDDLLATDVQVTSAMKRLQDVSETAASLYVLSNKEILQSGVTTVAQALKLVPGMQVRQIDGNQWAITLRSTAGRYSSKLLVMIDGQSIYNPAFAGVYWEMLNIPLSDIERIEVIRGQGGVLWGSNATNGVVNIISKHTADTRGSLIQVGHGTRADSKVNFRVGGDLAKYSSFRLSGDFEKTDNSGEGLYSLPPHDDGQKSNITGRIDLNLNDDLSLLAQAMYTDIEMGQKLLMADFDTYQPIAIEDQYTREQISLMLRLEHRLSAVSNQMLQASISFQKGTQPNYYNDKFFTSDIDYQMNTLVNDIQFDWGVNYRYFGISLEDTDYATTINDINDIDAYTQAGGFVQAQFNLIPDKLKLVVGDRSERNSYTGWEHQPIGRLLWHPKKNHTVWGAISQGVRIPSLFETSVHALIPSFIGVRTEIVGSEEVDAEKSISKEIGYRYKAKKWSVDFSSFHTKAIDAIIAEYDVNDDNSLIRFNMISDGKLITDGGDAVIKWQIYEPLSVELGVSFTSYQYDLPPGTASIFGYDSYLRQLLIKTNYTISVAHSLSASYRIEGGNAYDTDDYSVLDLNWKWQVTPLFAFSLTGNNLLYGKHLEYNNSSEVYTVPTHIEPSYIVSLSAEF